MAHLDIKVDGKQLFDGDVEDWNPTPELPEIARGTDLKSLPVQVREALALALAKTLEKTTGFRTKVYLR